MRGLVAACLLMAGGGIAAGLEWRAVAKDLGRTRDLHAAAYVGSAACRGCHDDHLASWHRTFHRTMTAEAAPDSVRGDFSGVTLTSAGVTTRGAGQLIRWVARTDLVQATRVRTASVLRSPA